MLTNVLLKGDVSPRYVPIAAIMMTVFLLDLYFGATAVTAAFTGTSLNPPATFFAHWTGWRVGVDLFFIAFFGGIYAVPLNAIMQHRSNPARRSRVIAANNVINAIFMIGSALAAATLLKVMSPQGFFLLLGHLPMPVPPSGSAGCCRRNSSPRSAARSSACSTASRSRAWRISAPRAARR